MGERRERNPFRRFWLWPALTAGLMLACGGPRPASDTTDTTSITPADRLLLASAKVALPPTGITPGSLPDPGSDGARYLQTYCSACHALTTPLAHSATDWPRVARRMWLRMGLMDSALTVPTPTTGERLVMLRYLVDNALKVSTATLPDAPGREAFETTCSQCHELPDPTQHSAEDWVAVTRRMQDHMEEILGTSISPTDLATITSYLGSVSAGQ